MEEYSIIRLIKRDSSIMIAADLGIKTEIGYSLELIDTYWIGILRFTDYSDKGHVCVCKKVRTMLESTILYMISDTTNTAHYSKKISFKLFRL